MSESLSAEKAYYAAAAGRGVDRSGYEPGYATDVAQRAPGLMSITQQRVAILSQCAAATLEALQSSQFRVFGEGGASLGKTDSANGRAQPVGQVHELSNQLDSLESLLMQCREVAQRLTDAL